MIVQMNVRAKSAKRAAEIVENELLASGWKKVEIKETTTNDMMSLVLYSGGKWKVTAEVFDDDV